MHTHTAHMVYTCEGHRRTYKTQFFLSAHHVDPGDQTQVVRLGDTCFIYWVISLALKHQHLEHGWTPCPLIYYSSWIFSNKCYGPQFWEFLWIQITQVRSLQSLKTGSYPSPFLRGQCELLCLPIPRLDLDGRCSQLSSYHTSSISCRTCLTSGGHWMPQRCRQLLSPLL